MAQPGCTFASECCLHRHIAMEAALRVWESFYCDGAFRRCERFLLHDAGREVPDELLPNGRLLEGFGDPRPASSRHDRPRLVVSSGDRHPR
jgi:hypothetical protein